MPEKKQYKVLLLEDSFEDAELVQRRLGRTGLDLNVKHVVTRPEFLESLEAFSPDIIISDYKLPDLDGLSALRIARQKNPQIPFIMVSGFIDDKFASETLEAGVTDFLLKDRLERLGSAVMRAIREAEQRRIEEEYAKRAKQLEVENEEMQRRESRIKQLKRELLSLRGELKNFE